MMLRENVCCMRSVCAARGQCVWLNASVCCKRPVYYVCSIRPVCCKRPLYSIRGQCVM